MNFSAAILFLLLYRCVLILFAFGWWIYLWRTWKNQKYMGRYGGVVSADENPKKFRLNLNLSVVGALFLTVGAIMQIGELIQMFEFLSELGRL